MNIEKLLNELKGLNPYQLQILKDQLAEHNERKMIETVGRLILGFTAMMIWFLTR